MYLPFFPTHRRRQHQRPRPFLNQMTEQCVSQKLMHGTIIFLQTNK